MSEVRELAMVDVELFVLSGVPRDAFTLVPAGSTHRWPKFLLSDETLLRLGWTLTPSGYSPPAGCDPEAPHPCELGPMWMGGNSWRATFRLEPGDVTVEAFVDHEWYIDGDTDCDPGPPLTSRSPWRWRIVGLPDGTRCGRGENPVMSAAAAEALVAAAGATPFPRTATRRQVPD